MSTITLDLPGLDESEAYNLIRSALFEWAAERGGRHPHRWAESADELAQAYVERRYPLVGPDGSVRTSRFQWDKAVSTARKLRAVCGFKMVTVNAKEEG